MIRRCSKDGCNQTHKARGLCSKHYNEIPERKAIIKAYYTNNPQILINAHNKVLSKYGKVFYITSNQYSYTVRGWAKLIKLLDNNMCKNCNSIYKLNTHHIQPQSLFPKLALDLDNGVTLCKNCHQLVHGFDLSYYS